MRSIKTIMAACLAAAVLSFGALSLVGCGPSAEEVVRQGVADELERLKTHDAALLDELAADSGADQLAAYGIDAQTFIAAYLDGLDYRIDEVTVEGDDAAATVVLTCKKFDAFTQALTEATTALAEDEETAALDGDELNAKIGQVVLEVLAGVEPTESNPWSCRSRAPTTCGAPRPARSKRCPPPCSPGDGGRPDRLQTGYRSVTDQALHDV